jgi:hypothetical protein
MHTRAPEGVAPAQAMLTVAASAFAQSQAEQPGGSGRH